MKGKQFAAGFFLGTVLSAFIAFGIYRAHENPVYFHIAGTVQTDSATYKDNRPGLYLKDPVYPQDRIYLNSKNIDINDIYKLARQPVKVYGRIGTLSSGEEGSILQLEIENITPIKIP